MRAATRVNAGQASKRVMRKPTRRHPRGRLTLAGKRATRAPAGSAGVVAAARMEEGGGSNTGSPWRWRGTRQPTAREGWVGPPGVAERLVVPMKSGNADGGKGPWFESGV